MNPLTDLEMSTTVSTIEKDFTEFYRTFYENIQKKKVLQTAEVAAFVAEMERFELSHAVTRLLP